MTKKEQEPRNNSAETEKQPSKLEYSPKITKEDKEVLNNQSQDEEKGEYFNDRQEHIDYEGDELDVPEFDEEQFNPTTNKADDSEKEELPKNSANSNEDIKSETNTVYRGESAERYRDPSNKTRKNDSGNLNQERNED